MKVEMLSVGTELLLGDILNTNVQYLCRQCAALGLDVYHTGVVGDNEDRLYEAIAEAMQRCDLLILTGGLGATHDDITKRVVIRYAQRPTFHDPASKDLLDRWFEDPAARKEQEIVSEFPVGSTILPNRHGTASGAWIPAGEGAILILPGPPQEMIPMFEDFAMPLLHNTGETTQSLPVRIGVLGEAQVNQRFSEAIQCSKNPTFAPYVKEDGTLLRITAKAASAEEAQSLLQTGYARVQAAFPGLIVNTGEETKPQTLQRRLAERGEQIATAESITGGLLAATIIDAPGASEILEKSWVVYSDRAKHEELGVPRELLAQYTAVSAEVAEAMARGAAERSGAEWGLSTTGYAGPDGEAVGKVYIGISYRGEVEVHALTFHGDRQAIRRRAKNVALDFAILRVKREDETTWERK